MEDEEQMRFTLFLDQIPSGTAQQKRMGYKKDKLTGKQKVVFFDSDSVADAKRTYMYMLRRYAPRTPLKGPVCLAVTFQYAVKDKKKRGKWKVSRPDCDNIVKVFVDCLTKCGFFEDDNQVCKLTVAKVYSLCDKAAMSVSIEEMGNEENDT